MKSEILFRIQLAVFFVDLIRDPEGFAEKIVNKASIFDEKLPREYMKDHPYISNTILKNAEKRVSIAFTPDRVDFVSYRINSEDKRIVENFESNIPKIINAIFEYKEIARIGLIANVFMPSSDPADEICKKYFKQSVANNSKELSFRYNKTSVCKNVNINNITIVESVNSIEIDESNVMGIVITRDINNVFQENGITKEFVYDFLKEYQEKIYNI